MNIIDSCAECIFRKQQKKTDNQEYLAEVRKLLDERSNEDCSPSMVYEINKIHTRYFGSTPAFTEEKKQYNDLVLAMEEDVRKRIEAAEDPLMEAFFIGRVGNYIDFGTLNEVSPEEFLGLFEDMQISEADKKGYSSLIAECEKAKKFLLLADNAGEIVLDKLFLEQLKKRFRELDVTVMVRGGEILNDATLDDAKYVGIDRVAHIVSNGKALAGTVYKMLSDEARETLDQADVILAKGQGNYESLGGSGKHVFFTFLCKCERFTERFQVPRLTGLIVEE